MDIAVIIVNSLAVLVAVVGLIVTNSQFKKTMESQNRATNVSLFDLRMEILVDVENNDFSFSRTRAQMLFDSGIALIIKEYDNAAKECSRYMRLKREFIDLIQSERSDDTYEEITDFLSTLQAFDALDPEDPLYQQLQESIRNRCYTGKWLNGVSPLEFETVNYVDIKENESFFYNKSKDLRKQIIEDMKKLIETSIK